MNIPRIVRVGVKEGYVLSLEFDDGTAGEVDIAAELTGTMFEPLREIALFRQASLNRELNTICWPNGADLAPEWLYEVCHQGARAD